MGYTVYLKDTDNGREHSVYIDRQWCRFSELKNCEVSDLDWWQQGSNSCDCARLTYMYPDNREHLCNLQPINRIVVTKIITDEGKLVYAEIEIPKMSVLT